MIEELKEVREALAIAAHHKYGDGDVTAFMQKNLATLNRILNQDAAEMVERVERAMFSETLGFDSFTQEKMRDILPKQAKAALRAVGMIGGE